MMDTNKIRNAKNFDELLDNKYGRIGTEKRDEFAIQFKHRIVKIHCFPNGNGRHSRLLAD